MKIIDKIRERGMPKQICVAGSAIMPPIGVAIIVGLVMACAHFGGQIYRHYYPPMVEEFCAPTLNGTICWENRPAPREPSAFDSFLNKWGKFVFLGLIVGFLWVVFGLLAYIHCHQFWHDEKPFWAKKDDDFEDDYYGCPECEEDIGQCEHWGTTC